MGLLTNAKLIYGILAHDLAGYVESFRITKEWSEAFPHIDPSNFKALEAAAWDEIEKNLDSKPMLNLADVLGEVN
jgi:hypothetical protein